LFQVLQLDAACLFATLPLQLQEVCVGTLHNLMCLLRCALVSTVCVQVLIAHARTCPGHHLSRAHGEVCKSVKYLMLHIRDCCGRTPDGQACGFPWCKPSKYLIHHLVKCKQPDRCAICSPHDLPPALLKLRALNQLRDAPSAAAHHNHHNHTAHQQPPAAAAPPAASSGHSSSANHH